MSRSLLQIQKNNKLINDFIGSQKVKLEAVTGNKSEEMTWGSNSNEVATHISTKRYEDRATNERRE